MMLAKLMPTLSISIAPAATRSRAMSASATRLMIAVMGRSVGGAHHLQHIMHRGLILGRLISDRIEQRLQFGEVVVGQRMHGAAELGPGLCQILGEIDAPLLRLGLRLRPRLDDDLLQIRRQRVEPWLADDGKRYN